jgi:CheY-like chemotaxis protein
LVELHGGTIEASSEGEGRGARFTLSLRQSSLDTTGLPALSATLPPRTTVTPASAVSDLAAELAGLRVLVVDDEQDARELTSTILSEGGALVVAAASASDALKALNEQPLDVMISDIGMPEQDGYQLIRRVRELATPAARIPAAALTAFTRNEERRKAMVAGFQLHISKPVEPFELTAAVACLARIGRLAE